MMRNLSVEYTLPDGSKARQIDPERLDRQYKGDTSWAIHPSALRAEDIVPNTYMGNADIPASMQM